AAQEALLLLAAPNINEAGARSVAFGRIELFQQGQTFRRLGEYKDVPPPHTYKELAEEIEDAAKRWDRLHNGMGDYLRAAAGDLLPKFEAVEQGKRHPQHWSGMSRRQMARHIQSKG